MIFTELLFQYFLTVYLFPYITDHTSFNIIFLFIYIACFSWSQSSYPLSLHTFLTSSFQEHIHINMIYFSTNVFFFFLNNIPGTIYIIITFSRTLMSAYDYLYNPIFLVSVTLLSRDFFNYSVLLMYLVHTFLYHHIFKKIFAALLLFEARFVLWCLLYFSFILYNLLNIIAFFFTAPCP